ncbi:MAG: Gfo/Idh/MocA family oxidoreductase [Bacteroidales bacterium]|nr:Gfo/Idh/MocA family oxidoreductase [Bacteroidales bacterium]
MKKVITYGTFDLLHEGHLNLLRRAKALGDYLIVGVTTDSFDLERGKMNTVQSVTERIAAVLATGLADQVIIEEYKGQKLEDIQKYDVDIFAIGSDWVGKFDYIREFCEVVYLPRTEGISSTQLRENLSCVRVGIVGTGSIASRFVPEAAEVNGVKVVSAFNPDPELCADFCRSFSLAQAGTYEQLLESSDAVYVASPHYTHYEYVKQAIEAGRHVLCETPFVLRSDRARELYELSESRGVFLMVAHKTAYCPAFVHLVSLLKSGIIGDIVDVNASVTTLTDENSDKLASSHFGGSVTENACFPLLPVFKFFGTDWKDLRFYSKVRNGVDIYTKGILLYDNAVASFQVGLGAKTEGNLVVSGTRGYAYVPAPWWRTDYFEIRYEDQNQNKKYFYPFAGEGLRYEIKDFVGHIAANDLRSYRLTREENIRMADVTDAFLNKIQVFQI